MMRPHQVHESLCMSSFWLRWPEWHITPFPKSLGRWMSSKVWHCGVRWAGSGGRFLRVGKHWRSRLQKFFCFHCMYDCIYDLIKISMSFLSDFLDVHQFSSIFLWIMFYIWKLSRDNGGNLENSLNIILVSKQTSRIQLWYLKLNFQFPSPFQKSVFLHTHVLNRTFNPYCR